MENILKGVTVLDFGRFIAGPFCASLLGDLGANVIRVEKFGINEDRNVMTPDITKDGAVFLAANRNKRSISLNLSTNKGKYILKKLVLEADVVIANMPTSYLKQLGLNYEQLILIKKDIIFASINGFGHGNDQVAFDGIAQVISGTTSVTGQPNSPARLPAPYCDFGTALSCVYAILAAIIHKMQTGEGQHIHCSLVGTALMFSSFLYIQQKNCNLMKEPTGTKNQYGGPTDLFETSDGKVFIAISGNIQFKRWARLMQREDLLQNELYQTDILRGLNHTELFGIFSDWCKTRTTSEVYSTMQEHQIPCCPYMTLNQAAEYPLFHDMGFFKGYKHPHYENDVMQSSFPARFVTLGGMKVTRPPLCGENTEEILKSLGFSTDEINELIENEIVGLQS